MTIAVQTNITPIQMLSYRAPALYKGQPRISEAFFVPLLDMQVTNG